MPSRVLILLTSSREMLGMLPNSPFSIVLCLQLALKSQPRQRGLKCQSTLSRGRERTLGKRRNRKSSREGARRLMLMLFRSSKDGREDSRSNPSAGGSQIAALPAG
jgi:hypothetical protein